MIYSTVALDHTAWDLRIDALGNIAVEAPRSAVAQDVASAVRTIQGELFYDTTVGIPYMEQVLGQNYIPQLVKTLIEQAALTVPGVVSALATIALDVTRNLTGTIEVVDETGSIIIVTL